MLELFFEKMLGLESYWKVSHIEFNENGEVDIFLDFDLKVYKSNDLDFELIHDYRPNRRWRHLDILQYKTFINARIPRIKRKDSTIRSIDTSWANSNDHHTYLFECHVLDTLLITKNQTGTAFLTKSHFNLINRILHRAVERGLERRNKGSLVFLGDSCIFGQYI